MAFGTDDEKALENGFNNNFERATHLSCEIHLKNLEKKLIELGITGHVKDNVIFDVFGRQNGDVFESGLADAANKEEFENLLKCLKQRWSDAQQWFIFLQLVYRTKSTTVPRERNKSCATKSRSRLSSGEVYHQQI